MDDAAGAVTVERPVNRAPRFALALAAELRTPSFRTAGTTRNVSVGGVCVEIDRELKDGEQLDLSLYVVEDDIEAEGKTTLDLRATVQWCAEADRGYAVGLKFVDPPPQKLAMLERVLAMLPPE